MILVTGGAGYVGSHCVKELLQQGYEVAVLDNLSQGHREAVLAECFIQADLLDLKTLDGILDRYPIDAVIHFAALASVGGSVENPQQYYYENVIGTLNLLQMMLKHSVKEIIFSSSAAVYGDPMAIPIPENHPKCPKNPYGRTKWIIEQILEDYRRAYGLRYIILRYFNAAGCDPEGDLGEDHNPETHLIPLVLNVALRKQDHIVIFGTDYPTPDGTCIRDYVHVSDLALAHVLALKALNKERCPRAVYNLGLGHGYSVKEVIEVCKEVTGQELPTIEGDRRAGDPAVLVANSERARKELGWEPRYQALEIIIESAWQWRKKHPDGYIRR